LKQLQDTTALVDRHLQEFFDLFSLDHAQHFSPSGEQLTA